VGVGVWGGRTRRAFYEHCVRCTPRHASGQNLLSLLTYRHTSCADCLLHCLLPLAPALLQRLTSLPALPGTTPWRSAFHSLTHLFHLTLPIPSWDGRTSKPCLPCMLAHVYTLPCLLPLQRRAIEHLNAICKCASSHDYALPRRQISYRERRSTNNHRPPPPLAAL